MVKKTENFIETNGCNLAGRLGVNMDQEMVT